MANPAVDPTTDFQPEGRRQPTIPYWVESLPRCRPFAPQGGSIEGDLKKKELIGVEPNQYVTSYSWTVYEWGWA